MRAIIVGSGPSAAGFVPPEGETVIAVNGAIDWLPRADSWFTLDPSDVNRSRMTHRRPGVLYYAALPADMPAPDGVTVLERVSGRGAEPQPHGTPEWWLWRWSAVLGLCEEPGKIHTGNSAFGAIGLAFHMGIRRILLVGIDATSDSRIEGGQPNDLSHLPILIQSAQGQVDISSVSAGAGVPVVTVEEWCRGG